MKLITHFAFVLSIAVSFVVPSARAQDVEETQGCVRGIKIPENLVQAEGICAEKGSDQIFSKCPTTNSPILIYKTGCKVKYFTGVNGVGIRKVKDKTTGETAKFTNTGKLKKNYRVGDYDHVQRWIKTRGEQVSPPSNQPASKP